MTHWQQIVLSEVGSRIQVPTPVEVSQHKKKPSPQKYMYIWVLVFGFLSRLNASFSGVRSHRQDGKASTHPRAGKHAGFSRKPGSSARLFRTTAVHQGRLSTCCAICLYMKKRESCFGINASENCSYGSSCQQADVVCTRRRFLPTWADAAATYTQPEACFLSPERADL